MSPVASKLNDLRSAGSFAEYDIFTQSNNPPPRDTYRAHLSTYDYLEWSIETVRSILTEKPELLRFAIPGEVDITLELYRKDFFASGYQVRTSDGHRVPHTDMAFYHGQISGKLNSLAAVSIFDDEIRIMYADNSGSYRVQQTDGTRYIRFNETDQLNVEPRQCFVDESHDILRGEKGKIRAKYRSTGNCVEIYFECDEESYLDNGSDVTETEEWVTALFNEVAILYDNEMIPLSISEILVWTSTDPYASLNSTSAVLNEFVDQISVNGYSGRLAHLLSTRSLGGGIAYLNVLCSNTYQCAVSASLSTNIVEFPTYSWNVNVVAHETGHNFGSNHTHKCIWNGDNTQIDDCGSYAGYSGGACYDEDNAILPEEGGTIMSYCHLVSGVGINYNNGFGPLPGDVLRDSYNEASCNTGDCFAPNCTMLTDPEDNDVDIDIAATVSWEPVAGAGGYKITMGTSSGGNDIADDVDVGTATNFNPAGMPFGTTVYVNITPYNSLGDAVDCTEETFQTESNSLPLCTQLSYPADGAIEVDFNVTLEWTAAVGNQTNYLLNVGWTSGGGEIVNNLSTGNVTSYSLSSLPEETTIFVRVTPFGPQGSASECPITSFTTKEGLVGDACTDASGISCGTTVFGSTLEAMDDDVSNCGTTNTTAGVWYTFTGDGSNVTVSTCGAANYDTKLSVYKGSCAQLICVGGNDDWIGCNYGSQVSFVSIDGTEYFILVHGWNTSIGNFNLTMACEEAPYCPSQGILDDDEWISEFTFGTLSNSSGASHYSDFTNQIIEVIRGESYSLSVTPDFMQETYNEYFRVWIDYNADGDFDDTGENIYESGPATSTVNGTITIPDSAVSGDRLMRVAMKYNSFSGSCDVFTYGEVEEYTVRIRCDVVTSTDDSGAGTMRDALSCVASGDTIYFGASLQGQTITISSTPISINKNVVFLADPAEDISVSGQSVSKVFEISAGNNVVLQGLSIIGGTSSMGNGIDNSGNLVLRDVSLRQHAGDSGATLLHNQGQVTLEGNCDIKDP